MVTYVRACDAYTTSLGPEMGPQVCPRARKVLVQAYTAMFVAPDIVKADIKKTHFHELQARTRHQKKAKVLPDTSVHDCMFLEEVPISDDKG